MKIPGFQFVTLKLFWISFVILFLEMASIRWLNASVTVLAYFNNLILISCFFGLGVGCLLASKNLALIRWYPLVFLLFVLVVLLMNKFGIDISYKEDVIFVGNSDYYLDGLVDVSLSAVFGFFINVGLFIILGQELGKQLRAFDHPLKAYGWDILGSLAGTLCFAVVGWVGTPPHLWYAISALVILGFFIPEKKLVVVGLILFGLAIFLIRSTYPTAMWSPYYKVETITYGAWKNQNLGYKVIVDNLRIQDAINFRIDPLKSPLWPLLFYYYLPYEFRQPSKVLILGGGSGNDATSALIHGAREVHVVEIDPLIASFGYFLHPNRPYRSKKVKVFVDDARSFISNAREKYDHIVMSALDSHKQIAGMANLRLESFMYTVEAFRQIKKLLEHDGIFTLNLSSTRPWMGERIYWTLTEAFGKEPKIFKTVGSPFDSVAYVFGPERYMDKYSKSPNIKVLPGYPPEEDTMLASDDWPYLYLQDNIIPSFCLLVFGIIMVLSFFMVYSFEPSVRKPNLHFFFLGAGFMLLQTRSVTQMGLLFGTTWNVNTLVFASILLAIFIANFMVINGICPTRRMSYVLLFVTLALGYIFPFNSLLHLSFALRLLSSALIVGLPIAFAAFIFSLSFKEVNNVSKVFGSNLLGIVFGGALEYTVNIWGLRVLYVMALVLYACSYALLRKTRM